VKTVNLSHTFLVTKHYNTFINLICSSNSIWRVYRRHTRVAHKNLRLVGSTGRQPITNFIPCTGLTILTIYLSTLLLSSIFMVSKDRGNGLSPPAGNLYWFNIYYYFLSRRSSISLQVDRWLVDFLFSLHLSLFLSITHSAF